jgi:nucleotide-binding universal stress UspA family protein
MSNDPNRVVIIGTLDRTPAADWVIHTATTLAATLPHAEVHFLHVVAPEVMQGAAAYKERILEARSYVDRVASDARDRFRGKVTGHVATGQARQQILQLASDLEADLVVVGASHRRSVAGRWLLGSISQSIIQDASCAVLVARPKEAPIGPEIQPPCPQCVEVQRASQGDKLWCAQHATHHIHAHLPAAGEAPASLGGSSVFIRT